MNKSEELIRDIKDLSLQIQNKLNECLELQSQEELNFKDNYIPYIFDSLMWLQHLEITDNALTISKEYKN